MVWKGNKPTGSNWDDPPSMGKLWVLKFLKDDFSVTQNLWSELVRGIVGHVMALYHYRQIKPVCKIKEVAESLFCTSPFIRVSVLSMACTPPSFGTKSPCLQCGFAQIWSIVLAKETSETCCAEVAVKTLIVAETDEFTQRNLKDSWDWCIASLRFV